MSLRKGIPARLTVTVSWMSPPRTRVVLLTRTTDVSASRLMISGDPVGATGDPMALTSCLTSRATVPCSPIRGVTVRTTPASRYSTDCVPTTAAVALVVVPVVPGTVPPMGTC